MTKQKSRKAENQILASAKKYRKWFVIGPVFKLTEAIFELLIPTLMVYIIDRGVTGRDGAYVLRMMPLMIGIAVLGYLSALVCQYVASLSSQGFGTELRNRLFRRMLDLPQKDADRLGASAMVNRVTNDVNILQQAAAMLIRLAIRAPFICIGSLIMAAMLNLKLTLIILCALPLLIAAVALVMKLSVPLFGKVQKRLDNIAVISRENMSGARVIRAFSRSENEKKRFGDESKEYYKAVVRVNRISAMLNPLTTLIMNVAVIAVLWFGGKMIDSGDMTGGRIIAFVNYISYMVTALLVVANLVNLFTKAAASAKRVNEIFELPAGGGSRPAASPDGDNTAQDAAPVFELVNASLKYSGGDDVPAALEGANLAVFPGEVLGIVGITGSGKTSLVSLLTGLYACTGGEVRIKGRNIHDWDKKELSRTVRIASQQSTLFSGSVAENIRAGDPSVTEDEIREALRIAQAEEFVDEKGGIEARVERGGANFSGGQRQRLSVARAVVKKPEVLILDDSFSALDNATASAMLGAIRGSGIKTLVIVSQRAGSVRYADRILVLDDGKCAGLGSHAELLETSEIYAEICRLSGEAEDEGQAGGAGPAYAAGNAEGGEAL
ncbi:MAG: ABC transporter ATP-binding protein [Clostridia bacterium]|nr:ABC transporter ATP-binding protein [Clostridia bacterium]